jgi:hypothetical protein
LSGYIKRLPIASHARSFWTYIPVTGLSGLLLHQKKTRWNSMMSRLVELTDSSLWPPNVQDTQSSGARQLLKTTMA